MSKSRSRTKASAPSVSTLMQRFAADNPDPRCELYYATPYQLLVSVVLSAQATDKSVNKAMQPVYDEGFTPEVAISWGEAGILRRIRSIGLAPTKAKNVAKLSRILLDDFAGEVPHDRTALESLPGVGRKTANVILAEIWREPTLAVDTHVFRVGARLGLHAEKTAEKAETALLKKIDTRYLPQAHHWLILHGRYVCKAQSPACGACIVSDLCPKVGVSAHATAAPAPRAPRLRARAKP